MLYTQLRSFHAVATEGGFTAASKVLRVGQPTITSQVRALEDAFDVELFHRRGRRVFLSEAGEGLFAITKRMISQEREAIDYLNELSGFQSGHLRLGAVGPYNIIDMVSAFAARPFLTRRIGSWRFCARIIPWRRPRGSDSMRWSVRPC
jgi:DNA-binding transcriptional LysR family regulator